MTERGRLGPAKEPPSAQLERHRVAIASARIKANVRRVTQQLSPRRRKRP